MSETKITIATATVFERGDLIRIPNQGWFVVITVGGALTVRPAKWRDRLAWWLRRTFHIVRSALGAA